MSQKVTLKQIASIAGLSINSVSKALKDSKNISEETKKRVKEIARDLGYFPNVHAQFLRNGSYNVVAIVYDNIVNPYYQIMLEVIHTELSQRGFEAMIFVDHHSIGHLSSELARSILSYGVKGILTFITPTADAKEVLHENHMPIVLIGRDGRKLGIESVFSNDYLSGKLAAQELIRRHGTSFAYVTEHSELKINERRLAGFRNELTRHGISLKQQAVISGNVEIGIDELIRALLKKQKIDSVFCFSDIIAFKVVTILSQLGYRVPEDINLIGVDNIQRYFPYPLRISSIDTPKLEMVQRAIDFLFTQTDTMRFYKENVLYCEGNSVIDRKETSAVSL